MRQIRFLILLLLPAKAVLGLDGPAEADRAAEIVQGEIVQGEKVPAASLLSFVPPPAGQERYRLVDRDAAATDQAAIEIRGEAGQSLTPIVEADDPPVTSHQYVVRGRVKYENVEGQASLEMWNDFGPRGAYFTRTAGDVGPLRTISGTSDWRDIELPFCAEPGMKPSRITISVIMPGKGTIYLSPLTIQAHDVKYPVQDGHASAWWNPRQSGLVGGIGGSALGILGGMIGFLASQRRARGVVVSLLVAGVACGIGLLIAGVIALCLRQPFFVVYPLLLLGGISALVLGLNTPVILRRYREDEFRRMAALDATAFGSTPATSSRG